MLALQQGGILRWRPGWDRGLPGAQVVETSDDFGGHGFDSDAGVVVGENRGRSVAGLRHRVRAPLAKPDTVAITAAGEDE